MKLKIILPLILFLLMPILQAQQKHEVTWDYRGQRFADFVEAAEQNLQLRFFYRDEWISGLVLGEYPGADTLEDILTALFREKLLYFFIDSSGNVVVTKNFSVKFTDAAAGSSDRYMAPTDYGEAGALNQGDGNVFYEVGNPAEKNNPGTVVITGYVTNRDTREPVAGATVFVKKLSVGAVTNAYGFYSLTLPRGIHYVQFTFVGMRDRNVNLNLNGAGEMNVEMNSVLIPLKETVVSAQKNITLQRFEVGAEKINITSFKLLPAPMGESDIIKSVLLIPGVQSVGEGAAGFNVRGGTADQNLILLYGAPIYNPSHLFGFFSVINSDVIKDVTLYKGGIPGRYGGRISSVLDIGTRDGNRKEFAGSAGISPITTHLMVEGPIRKDTLTYILTGRTTYSNYLLKLIDDPAIQNSRASFYDLNGKITYDLNKNNKIDFSGYYSHDSFRFNSDTVYSYDNNIFALRWKHFFTSRFFSTVSLNNSFYKYDISSNENNAEAFIMSHTVNTTGFKADVNWFKGRNEINFGADLNRHAVLPGRYLPAGDSSLVIPKTIPEERAWEGALYADDKFTLTNYLSVNLGLRYSLYRSFGPATEFVYSPDYSKSRSTITDTLTFSRGETTSGYGGPELRISLNFRLSDNNSVKVNYNRTRQYMHLLSNTTSISPTDTWKLCDYHVRPQIGDQVAVGFYKMLRRNTIETSVEVYYKKIQNLVDFKGGTQLVMNEDIEKDIINAEGKAYGVELAIKKSEGRIRYGVGYTYSRTFIRSTSDFADEIINGGDWFPANYDKPHDLSATFNFIFSRRLNFSANYIYSTGRPITYPMSTYHFSDKILVHYSDRNKYRLPYYSRLDLSMMISGSLKSRKIAHPVWTFSVYNLLGRENVYSVYFEKEGSAVKGYKLSVFARAIPSITFSFDF